MPTYEQIERWNSGLYGLVYKAVEMPLNRQVALKIIKPEWLLAASAIAHAKKLAQVGHHPNMVSVYGVERIKVPEFPEPQDAVVMEWIDGPSLGIRLGQNSLTVDEARSLCFGMLDGLTRIHECGLAHGDLNLGNIIIQKGAVARIIDINPDKDITLARLSEHSAEAAKKSDIENLAGHCLRILHSAKIPLSVLNNCEDRLRFSESIDDLRVAVQDAISARTSTPAVSQPVETAQSFRELIDDNKTAILHGELVAMTQEACRVLVGEQFALNTPVSSDTYRKRVQAYDGALREVLQAIATLAYWGRDEHIRPLLECVEGIASAYGSMPLSGNSLWINMQQYPVVLLGYAAGMGAFCNERFSLLQKLLSDLTYTDNRGNELEVFGFPFRWKAEERDAWNKYYIPNGRQVTPISEHLQEVMSGTMQDLTVAPRFQRQFDRFEYFVGLLQHSEGKSARPGRGAWGPVGCFLWRYQRNENGRINLVAEAKKAAARNETWAPFRDGMFNGSIGSLEAAVEGWEEFLGRVASQLGVW